MHMGPLNLLVCLTLLVSVILIHLRPVILSLGIRVIPSRVNNPRYASLVLISQSCLEACASLAIVFIILPCTLLVIALSGNTGVIHACAAGR